MNKVSTALMNDEEWINQGKADAWEGKPKQTPEHDPQFVKALEILGQEIRAQKSSSKY